MRHEVSDRLRASASATAVLVGAALFAGCVSEASQVLVVFGTNAPLQRTSTVTASVSAAGRTAEVREWVHDPARPDSLSYPASFAIVPSPTAPARTPLTLRLSLALAAGPNGEPEARFERVARFAITPQRTTVLRLFLAVECASPATGCTTLPPERCTVAARCEEQQLTCGDDARCTPLEVTPVPIGSDDASAPDVADVAVDRPDTRDVIGPDTTDVTDVVDANDVVDAPDADPTCASGEHRCAGVCVSDADVAHCGASCTPCPVASGTRATCDGTRCGFECLAGRLDCDASPANGCETDAQSSVSNCGACGRTCSVANGTAACVAGVCTAAACNVGFHRCGATCADDRSLASCGTSCSPCPSRAGSTSTCDGSTCGFTCLPDFADCNGMPADGCEASLRTDVNHCGACGNRCPSAPNTVTSCTDRVCTSTCSPGFSDCDRVAATGCEVPNGGNCNVCLIVACPVGASTAPGSCPSQCTGGCSGDLCTIACDVPSACQSQSLQCPPGMRCNVNCSGVSSCQGLALLCPPHSTCTVDCIGNSACQSIDLACPDDAPCSMACSASGSCSGGTVRCGAGDCGTTCSPLAAAPAMNCGTACRCRPCGGC